MQPWCKLSRPDLSKMKKTLMTVNLMCLKEAREICEKQKKPAGKPDQCFPPKYLSPVEGLVLALEAIRFSARSRQN
jgi:hypothetical protein